MLLCTCVKDQNQQIDNCNDDDVDWFGLALFPFIHVPSSHSSFHTFFVDCVVFIHEIYKDMVLFVSMIRVSLHAILYLYMRG